MNIPGPLTGSHPLVGWLNRLRQWLISDRLVSVVGGKLQQTPTGRVLTIDRNAGGAPPAAALSLQRFRLKSISANVLVCRTWDGSTEGTTDIMVSRPTKLRGNIQYELIDNRLITYAYSSNTERVASATGMTSEQQNIVPRYLIPYTVNTPTGIIIHPGDEIYAAQFETALFEAGGIPVYFIDVNVDGRAWAKVYGT